MESNNIKLDKINLALSPGKIEKNPAAKAAPNPASEDVTVSNSMNKLMNLLAFEDEPEESNIRVLQIKQSIQANEYRIDFNNLSDKLLNNGVLRNIGD